MNWKRVLIYTAIMFVATAAAAFPFGFVAGFQTARGSLVSAWVVAANTLAVPLAACFVLVSLARAQKTRTWEHATAVVALGWLVSFPINVGVFGIPLIHWALSLLVGLIAMAISVPIGRFIGRNVPNSTLNPEALDPHQLASACPAHTQSHKRLVKTYQIYEHPQKSVPVVVKVGFSWTAFLIGPLWFLLNRMWVNFLIVTAFFIGGNLYFSHHIPTSQSDAILFLGMCVLFLVVWFLIGRLANSLLGSDLKDHGYVLKATVSAKSVSDARESAGKVESQSCESPVV